MQLNTSWLERQQNRTASDFIAHLVMEKKVPSESKAIAQAEDFFKRGDLRDVWKKFRRIVKGE